MLIKIKKYFQFIIAMFFDEEVEKIDEQSYLIDFEILKQLITIMIDLMGVKILFIIKGFGECIVGLVICFI